MVSPLSGGPSTTKPRKKGASEISPQEGNALKKPKSEPKRQETAGRLEPKIGTRSHTISFTSPMKGSRLAKFPGWKEAELSTCAGNGIPGAQMMITVYLSKARRASAPFNYSEQRQIDDCEEFSEVTRKAKANFSQSR